MSGVVGPNGVVGTPSGGGVVNTVSSVVGTGVVGGVTTIGPNSLKFNDQINSLYLALVSVGGM